MLAFEMDPTQWTVGTSRLFLKAGQLHMLEHLLDSGSMASKEMIIKIKRQFLKKKWRAVRSAVLFANWLPKYARRLRTVAVRTALRKTCYIYVRMMRWLDRARMTLYGTQPRRPSYPLEKSTQAEVSFVFPSKHGTRRLQNQCQRQPELFVALNRNENQDDYIDKIQHQIDSQKQVHDAVLNMWQKKITENVLFYDGRHLISTRLDPKLFLMRDADCAGQSFEGCLTDVRYIDVSETGLAMPTKAHLSPESEITFMCQHRRNSNTFATCHKSHILVWNWFGTDNLDTGRVAAMVDCGYVRYDDEIVYGMTFLSDVPESIASNDGQVLLLLTGKQHLPWLKITIVAIYQCAHHVIYIRNIGQNGSRMLEAAKSGKILFKTSHSDRVLVIGGKSVALFFEIQRSVPDGKGDVDALSLSLIDCPVAKLADEESINFVSCLCLPPPKGTGLDWVVFGDAEGDLFGFLFTSEAGRIELSESYGRFSSKQTKHDRGVPISTLMATHGATPNCHYPKIKEQGISYTVFLEGMESESDRFYSLGDNGKLLAWTLQRHGWTSQVEEGMEGDSEYSHGTPRRFIGAQSSRLVPHVMVAVDSLSKKIVCLDTVSKRVRHPMEAVVGGA
jgi:hypothetical protein